MAGPVFDKPLNNASPMSDDLLRLYIDENWNIIILVSPWIVGIGVAILLTVVAVKIWINKWWWHWEPVKVNIDLGGVGEVELRPNLEDVQVAHRIWVELVTRKAALPIDPERDVLVEVYDSWYALFGKIRQLIGDIPGHLVRKEESTRKLIKIATDTLNRGLRPHLTQWQAKFRSWYTQHADLLKDKTPQALQKEFPEYDTLISDMRRVNQQLIEYASELQKIVHGRR